MKSKKIEKEINNIVIHANQVSDSVLEQARKSMAESQSRPQKKPVIHKVLKPAILVPLFIVLMFCTISVSLATIEKHRNNYIYNHNYFYTYSELQKEPISSIEQYNLDNNTNYYYFKDLTILSSYELLSSNTNVGFEETYQYKEYTISMYFHSSYNEYDTDNDYIGNHKKEIGSFAYWYLYEDHLAHLSIVQKPMQYYITIDSDDPNIDEEILPYFIKSQSNWYDISKVDK